jgi:glycosyltransferase involved in cell wall biosynthesis
LAGLISKPQKSLFVANFLPDTKAAIGPLIMNVVVSVGGTWHAPHLAYQLQKREMLEAVYTTIPPGRFCARAEIDRERLAWLPWPEMIGPRPARLLRIPHSIYDGSYAHSISFDFLVSTCLRHRHRPDLVVAFAWYGLNTFRLCQREGIKRVVERGSAHTCFRERILAEEYDYLGIEHKPKRLDQRIRERELSEYEIADYISVPSAFAEDSFLKMGIRPEKLLRIPYGVDVERFYPAPRHRSRFQVISVGNLGVEKGTGYLLDGVEALKGLDIELSLVGTLDAYAIQRLQRCHLAWTFAGRTDQRDLPALYNEASVFCLLSLQEGFGMTILEAMACGLPVIISSNVGAADIISDGVEGFIIPIRSPELAAEKIKLLFQEPDLRREMGINARRKALSLSWNDYGSQVEKAYRDIVRGVAPAGFPDRRLLPSAHTVD